MAMGSHTSDNTVTLTILGASYILVSMMVGFVSSDLDKDRTECANQLVGLATCLPYVSGTAKAPTLDCCAGLKQVIGKSKKCLCILVKDRNDPNLGLKINATLALGLPTACNAPANVSECPALLHLAPNSPDAQVFEQFANSTKGSAPVASAKENSSNGGSGAQVKSDGGRVERRLGVETMVVGVSLWCLTPMFIMDV